MTHLKKCIKNPLSSETNNRKFYPKKKKDEKNKIHKHPTETRIRKNCNTHSRNRDNNRLLLKHRVSNQPKGYGVLESEIRKSRKDPHQKKKKVHQEPIFSETNKRIG